ncbi:hypothetical protein NC651_037871 [Populus alba x Populus x berolinensis]|nr:hypothetical protein NC651_037871 [Populus alba x Populus x berolinensis]
MTKIEPTRDSMSLINEALHITLSFKVDVRFIVWNPTPALVKGSSKCKHNSMSYGTVFLGRIPLNMNSSVQLSFFFVHISNIKIRLFIPLKLIASLRNPLKLISYATPVMAIATALVFHSCLAVLN